MADSDRRGTLLDSYENAAVIVSGIVADAARPTRTPCPRYDVAGLIDHLVEAGHRRPLSAAGRNPARRRVPACGAVRRARSATQRCGGGGTSMGRQFQLVAAVRNAVGRGQADKLDPSLALPGLRGHGP